MLERQLCNLNFKSSLEVIVGGGHGQLLLLNSHNSHTWEKNDLNLGGDFLENNGRDVFTVSHRTLGVDLSLSLSSEAIITKCFAKFSNRSSSLWWKWKFRCFMNKVNLYVYWKRADAHMPSLLFICWIKKFKQVFLISHRCSRTLWWELRRIASLWGILNLIHFQPNKLPYSLSSFSPFLSLYCWLTLADVFLLSPFALQLLRLLVHRKTTFYIDKTDLLHFQTFY